MSEEQRVPPRPTGKRIRPGGAAPPIQAPPIQAPPIAAPPIAAPPIAASPIAAANLPVARDSKFASFIPQRRQPWSRSAREEVQATQRVDNQPSLSHYQTDMDSRDRPATSRGAGCNLQPSTPTETQTTVAEDRVQLLKNIQSTLRLAPATIGHEDKIIDGVINILDRTQQEAEHLLAQPAKAYYKAQQEAERMKELKDEMAEKLAYSIESLHTELAKVKEAKAEKQQKILELERQIKRLDVGMREAESKVRGLEGESKKSRNFYDRDLKNIGKKYASDVAALVKKHILELDTLKSRNSLDRRNWQAQLDEQKSDHAEELKELAKAHAKASQNFELDFEILNERNAELQQELDKAEAVGESRKQLLTATGFELADKKMELREAKQELQTLKEDKRTGRDWKTVAEIVSQGNSMIKQGALETHKKLEETRLKMTYYQDIAKAKSSQMDMIREKSSSTSPSIAADPARVRAQSSSASTITLTPMPMQPALVAPSLPGRRRALEDIAKMPVLEEEEEEGKEEKEEEEEEEDLGLSQTVTHALRMAVAEQEAFERRLDKRTSGDSRPGLKGKGKEGCEF